MRTEVVAAGKAVQEGVVAAGKAVSVGMVAAGKAVSVGMVAAGKAVSAGMVAAGKAVSAGMVAAGVAVSAEEASAAVQGRCTRRSAQNAKRSVRFLSSQLKENLFFVGNAFRSIGPNGTSSKFFQFLSAPDYFSLARFIRCVKNFIVERMKGSCNINLYLSSASGWECHDFQINYYKVINALFSLFLTNQAILCSTSVKGGLNYEKFI